MKKIICLLLIIILNSSFVISHSAFASDLPAVALAKAGYTLAPNDILEIKILNQKNLDTKQIIAPDGSISLPFLGRVQAQGKTINEFQAYLTAELSMYVEKPQLVVYLTPRSIYVIQHDLNKNTWEVKEAKSIEEARAFAGKDYKGEIHYGDVIEVNVSKEPNWIADNWYRIITGTAVLVGIYATLNK